MTKSNSKFVFIFALLCCNVITKNLRETKQVKPILLIVIDGVGYSKTGLGDAVTEGKTPYLPPYVKTTQTQNLKLTEKPSVFHLMKIWEIVK